MMLKASAGAPAGDGDGEDGDGDGAPAIPVKAAVRVRIPLKRPEPPEEGRSEVSQGPKSKRSSHAGQEEAAPEEVDIQDHVLGVPTQGDAYQIYVIH